MLVIGPAVLIAAATYGRETTRTGWWVAALAAATACRLATLRLDRRIERFYARIVALLAVCWLALAWQVGPYRPGLVVVLFLLSPIAVLPWTVHRRVRGAVTVDWPSARARTLREAARFLGAFAGALGRQWAARAEFARMRDQWMWVSALRDIKLAGSELVGGRWSADGTRTLELRLANGRTIGDVTEVRERIEAVWEAAPGTVTVLPGERAHQVRLVVVRSLRAPTRPLSAVRRWPGTSITSVREPIPLGEWEDGTPILIRLVTESGMVGGHWLVAGMTRWGKSGVLNVILAALAGCPEVVFWGLDPKGGLELHPWHPLLARLAPSAREAVPFLQAANAERERRETILRERGARVWSPSAEEPLLLLIVDEASRLDDEAMQLLDDLCAMGAASGICVVVCTQRPSAAKLGKTGDLRAQLGSQISVKLRDAADADLVFGGGSAREGWRPDTLADRGALFIYHEATGCEEPRPGRAYLVSDEVVSATVERYASVRSQVVAESVGSLDQAADHGDARLSRAEPSPSAPAEQAAEPGRPALHVVVPDPEDPLVRLRELLAAAPPDGVKRSELIARIRMSDSWVDQHLRELRAAGEAVSTGRARWRAAGVPVRALAQEES